MSYDGKKAGKIVGVVIFVVFAILFVRDRLKLQELKLHYQITTATVTDYLHTRQGGTIYFYFYINGKRYEGHSGYGSSVKEIKTDFVNKVFPLIYSSKNFNNNRILITQYDFNLIGRGLPDSLLWAQQYF